MTKKNEKPAEATQEAEQVRQWYFPTLSKTVSAATYEEALALVYPPEEDEDEDGKR